MKIDNTEYDLLKKIIMYQTDFEGSDLDTNLKSAFNLFFSDFEMKLENFQLAKTLERRARDELSQYERRHHDETRHQKLLNLLPLIKLASREVVDDRFFKRHFKTTPMSQILLSLYLKRKAEKN